MSDTTRDGFLGGRLTVLQPRTGYRAGADPVFLASAVPAEPGQSVLELGCGVGVALLCLCHRVPGLDATGVEIRSDLAGLARENFAANGNAATIVQADLTRLPNALKEQIFDHVILNPPFFDRRAGYRADAPDRETGRGERTPLPVWIDMAIRRLKPRGRLTIIQRAERLPDILTACDTRVGDIVAQPLAPRDGRAAELVIVLARKGARGIFRLEAPLILHDGARHDSDFDSGSALAKSVLRDGCALEEAKFMHT